MKKKYCIVASILAILLVILAIVIFNKGKLLKNDNETTLIKEEVNYIDLLHINEFSEVYNLSESNIESIFYGVASDDTYIYLLANKKDYVKIIDDILSFVVENDTSNSMLTNEEIIDMAKNYDKSFTILTNKKSQYSFRNSVDNKYLIVFIMENYTENQIAYKLIPKDDWRTFFESVCNKYEWNKELTYNPEVPED